MPIIASTSIADNSIVVDKLAPSLRAQFRKIAGVPDFGGDGSDGALSLTSGTTNLSGFKQYSSISVSSGATLNLSGNLVMLCSGAVTMDGAITSSNKTTGGLGAESGQGSLEGNPTATGRGGKNTFDFLRYSYQRLAISGGQGGSLSRFSVYNIGRPGGGAGWGAGADGSGTIGSGVGEKGALPKYGFCIEAIGDISLGATATVDISGNSATDAGGAGGSYGLFCSLQAIALVSGATLTANGGSPNGGGGFYGFYYGTSFSNSATITTNGSGTAEAGTYISKQLTFI